MYFVRILCENLGWLGGNQAVAERLSKKDNSVIFKFVELKKIKNGTGNVIPQK
jgi:hypothetical protein